MSASDGEGVDVCGAVFGNCGQGGMCSVSFCDLCQVFDVVGIYVVCTLQEKTVPFQQSFSRILLILSLD